MITMWNAFTGKCEKQRESEIEKGKTNCRNHTSDAVNLTASTERLVFSFAATDTIVVITVVQMCFPKCSAIDAFVKYLEQKCCFGFVLLHTD